MARILITDDDMVYLVTMTEIMHAHGHAVMQASDGAEAAAALRLARIDLLITDIVMPNIDGLEIIRQVHTARPDLPILAIHEPGIVGQPDYLLAALAFGAWRTLAKPFSPDELIRTVNALLADARDHVAADKSLAAE